MIIVISLLGILVAFCIDIVLLIVC